jgi:autotransporter-associated beta strand protein/T5SS/PEP-CTERM-associated repeat protein
MYVILRITNIRVCLTVIAIANRVALADVWDNSSGNGQWSTATNWADNTEPGIADFATFPNTIPGGLSTITLSSGEFAQSLTFLNNYTLNGGNIQLGNRMITAGGWNSTINTVLAGAGPLTFGTSGTITLGASSNSYTGGTIINGTSMTLVVRSNSQLGFNTAPVDLNGGRLRFDGSTNPTFILLRTITPGSTGGTIDLANNAFLDLNAALGANANSMSFTGATGTAELNSTTTRTGATIVNGPVLRLNNPNGAGSGQITLQGGGTLELANNITFSAPVVMNNGTTLRAGTGTSTFNGTCNIPSAAAVVTLSSGPLTSDLLTLGTNGASVWNGSGTTQVSSGASVRLNSANNYAGNWQIAGSLRIDTQNSLGTGVSPIVMDGNSRLLLNTPLLARDITLGNQGGRIELLQDATVVGHITAIGATGFVPFIGSAYELTLPFANSSLTYDGIAFFGGASGVGSFRVSAGADVVGGETRLNGVAGGPARITVSGAGSTWTNTDEMWIGNIPTPQTEGQLLVEAGGAVSCPGIYIGVVGPGTATVTGEGSSLTSSTVLKIGLASQSTMSVLGGADISAQETYVGEGISASGSLTVDGAGSTWTNQSLLKVGKSETTSTAPASGVVALANSGTLSCLGLQLGDGATGSGTLTIGGAASALDVGSAGVLMSQNGASSTLDLTGGIVDIAGNITDGGAGVSTLTLDGATLDLLNHAIGGATPIDNLSFRSGTLKNVAQINNGAGLTKTGPGALYLNTPNTYTGSTTISQGTLFVVNSSGSGTGTGSVFVSSGATLAGPGRIAGPVQNSGSTAPAGIVGSAIGTLTLQSSYTQTAGGSLDIEIGGASVRDRLAVTGPATLAGTLNVTLINGFVPASGDTFDILTASARSGTFGTVNVPLLPAGRSWVIDHLPTGVRLRIVDSVPGDVDGDGHVTLSDLALLLSSFGACLGEPGYVAGADFDGDNCVGLGDLSILLGNFGA